MKLTKMTTVAAVLVAYVCSISLGVTGALAYGGGTFVRGNVKGTAVGADGKPLVGQEVKVYNSKGEYVTTVITDSSGGFDLSSLEVGDYTIAAGGVKAPLTIVPAGTLGAATAFTITVTGSNIAGAGLAGLTLLKWGGAGLLAAGSVVAVSNNINKTKQNGASTN